MHDIKQNVFVAVATLISISYLCTRWEPDSLWRNRIRTRVICYFIDKSLICYEFSVEPHTAMLHQNLQIYSGFVSYHSAFEKNICVYRLGMSRDFHEKRILLLLFKIL